MFSSASQYIYQPTVCSPIYTVYSPALLLTYPSRYLTISISVHQHLAISVPGHLCTWPSLCLAISVSGQLLTSPFTDLLTSSYPHPPSSFPGQLSTYRLIRFPPNVCIYFTLVITAAFVHDSLLIYVRLQHHDSFDPFHDP